MKGTQKLFFMVTFIILAFGLLPLFAQQLPYEGLDWLAYEAVIYYGDMYEPDNSRSEANEVAVGGAFTFHNFHEQTDEDWISFTASAGLMYRIDTLGKPLGSLADTVLALYDEHGTLLASDDDSGEMTDARITFSAPYSGAYYARVTEWAHRYGTDYWYDLGVTREVGPYKQYMPIIVRGLR